jgi:hypothetical protein
MERSKMANRREELNYRMESVINKQSAFTHNLKSAEQEYVHVNEFVRCIVNLIMTL